jgi:hypothetical protein
MNGRRPLRFAVVTEGPSDLLVLRAVIEKLAPDAAVVPVHPEVPLNAYPEYRAARGGADRGTGWKGVRAWCQEFGPTLELFMAAVVGEEYDALVVHVDASMADKVGAENACPPARATTDALRRVITLTWLGREELPASVILATPSKSTDAWVVATLTNPPVNLECDKGIEGELVRRRLLRRRDGEVKKPRTRYERLARGVADHWTVVQRHCSEANRFGIEVLAFTGQ